MFGAASVFSGNGTGPTWLAIVVVIFGILGLTLGVGFYTGARWAWMGSTLSRYCLESWRYAMVVLSEG